MKKKNYKMIFGFIIAAILVSALLFIIYSHLNKKLDLSGKILIADSNDGIISKACLIKNSDDLFVCWSANINNKTGDDEICYKIRSHGNWSKKFLLSDNQFLKREPQAAVDKKGRIHVIWGERQDAAQYSPFSKEIIYSVIENNKNSKPIAVFKFNVKNVNLGFIKYKINIDTSSNPLVFFISPLDSNSMPSLNILKIYPGNKFVINKIIGLVSDFDVHTDNNGVIHLVFTKSIQGKVKDINSIFYTTSKDNGITFSEPAPVHKSGRQGAYNPDMVLNGNNEINIVWAKEIDGKMVTDAVYYTCSSDGKTWNDEIRISGNGKGNCFYPAISINEENKLYALWKYSESFGSMKTGIFYTSLKDIKQDKESASDKAKMIIEDSYLLSSICEKKKHNDLIFKL